MKKLIFRIKSAVNDTGGTYYYVQRKENKWWKFLWETVCIQKLGLITVKKFSTMKSAQDWINRQNVD